MNDINDQQGMFHRYRDPDPAKIPRRCFRDWIRNLHPERYDGPTRDFIEDVRQDRDFPKGAALVTINNRLFALGACKEAYVVAALLWRRYANRGRSIKSLIG